MKLEKNQLVRILGIGAILLVVWLIFGIIPKSEKYLEVFTPRSIGAIALILAVIELFVAAVQKEPFSHIVIWITVILACTIPAVASWSVVNSLCLGAIAVTWIIIDGIKGGSRSKT